MAARRYAKKEFAKLAMMRHVFGEDLSAGPETPRCAVRQWRCRGVNGRVLYSFCEPSETAQLKLCAVRRSRARMSARLGRRREEKDFDRELWYACTMLALFVAIVLAGFYFFLRRA